MTPIDDLERQARSMFRLIGPRVTAAEDENVALRLCRICTPPEKLYECYLCQFTCQEQWSYNLHIKINPESCQRYAAKWAKRYAEMTS